jgi:fructoselysine 6-kinase
VAVFTARLGAKSSYVGCVGLDRRGQDILRALESEGVDLSHCRTRPGDTAWACVTQRSGDRVFLGSSPGVCKPLVLGPDDLDYFKGFDLVHSSIYSGLENDLARLRATNGNLSFDFSDDWDEVKLGHLAPHVKIAFLSGAHLDEMSCHAVLQQTRKLGPAVVVLTRGELGSMALAGGGVVSQSIVPTTVVDTLGAGDGFIAAFLLDWHQHEDLHSALQAAADYAAIVCNSAGGFGHGRTTSSEEIEQISRALGPP